ncbi:helicase/primase [Enterococcus phage EFP01]|uniref:Helicase/primase n=1 Tax=Enterococcus phage EFP01 TaxID=1926594 RepID=A0A288TY57_9CAUD|nr:DarB-like antirestriction [Enterococcus phage EFP01]APZ81984.1 helicase/primase [Enterococcus phage EFP01]
MSQIHKQTIYKAISEPLFAKDVFSRLPIEDFKEDGYDMIVSTLNLYYRTHDAPLEEQTLLTLVEDKMLKQNKSLEAQQVAFNLVSDLYKLEEAETDSEAISESVQNYVRKTLTREAIMEAVTNDGALGSDQNIQSLMESLRGIMTIDTGGHGAELLDFFADIDKKKEHLRNLQQNKYPTGFMAIDAISDGGLARGEVGMVIAPTGGGKALVDSEPVKTPKGDIAIKDLTVGSEVYGTDGKIYQVAGVFPQGKQKVYQVRFSDGTIVECNDEHIWTYQTKAMRGSNKDNWVSKTLREIIDTVPIKANGGQNIYIPMAQAVPYAHKHFSLHPYLIGALLGDGGLSVESGSLTFTNSERDLVDKVNNLLRAYGVHLSNKGSKPNEYCVSGIDNYLQAQAFNAKLSQLGLRGVHSDTKFIPQEYLKGSVEQRLDLLAGLIDTDGYTRGSSYVYYTVSDQLKDDVVELVSGLGMTAKVSQKVSPKYTYKGEQRVGKLCWVVSIKTTETFPKIHTTSKHEARWKKGQSWARRTIVSIVETDRMESMTCISVTSPNKLFLTRNYVATHNTTWAVNQARNYVVRGLNVLYIPLEEKIDRMIVRFEQLLSQQSKNSILVDGELNEQLYDQIQQAYGAGKEQLNWGNLWIRKYKPQELTPSGLSQLISDVMIRKGQQIDVVIIDYPDLMKNPHSSGGNGESDAGGKLYEDIRSIAQEYDFVCWTLSQLNRASYGQEVKNAGAIEGSKRKMNAVELIFTLNQTPEEFQSGFIRAYVDKLRNNSGVAYDKMLYFKVIPETMTIRDETQEERMAHANLLEQTMEVARDNYKKENNFTPKDAQSKINNLNAQLAGGLK